MTLALKILKTIGSLCILVLVNFSPVLAQDIVDVRNGDHPTFSRIVFDWQERVSYTAHLSDGQLEIIFDKASIPNWHNLRNEPLAYMADPDYRIEGDKLVVTLKVTKPATLKDFRYGTKIAFDVIGDDTVVEKPRVQQNPVQEAAVVETFSSTPGQLKVTVNRNRDSIRMRYPWAEDTRAAVFIRNNYLWVVFDGKTTVDQSDLDRFLGQRVLSAQQIDHPTFTILTYALVSGQNVKVTKKGQVWQVDLSNAALGLTQFIPGSQQRMAGHTGEIFFFSVVNAASPLLVTDPVIGDQLAIVPTVEPSQGVLKMRKFSEFEILPTAQGIAVVLIADNLNVLKYQGGIGITSKQGLALSRSQLSSQLDLAPDNGQATGGDKKLVDFTAWKRGPVPDGDYHENKHELLFLLSNSTDADRSGMRWNLARFYLANGRTREAYGVLSVMVGDDPKMLESPEFRIVLGVTHILMRHFSEGLKLLSHKSLLAERDALLWRAVAESELGSYQQAFEDYKKGADVLFLQDPENQKRFLFAAIRAAYELGNEDFVTFGLSYLQKLSLTGEELTEVDYWQALLDRDAGDLLKAEENLKGIVKAGVRQTAAWAKFDLINMDYQNKKIDETEAIDQLEKLRFAWRGDDFELELLSRLGDLYVQQKDFNTGLQTLRLAVTFFKESDKTLAMTRQMSKIYSDLFLHGGADVMEPVKAVSLYSEFRELIPLGTDGDNMTRRLVDRLVSLDLLEEAAELLKHQVKFRLKGTAQSVVAGRLAMIYLLDSKPQAALDILQATRDSQIPDDILTRRMMIEARALIELDRYEEAEVMLEDYKGKEADDLRSDIYWRSENWDKYIAHENRMLGKRYEDEAALSVKERLAVLRLSVAYVINGDKAGVKTLRDKYRSYMEGGLYGDTFEVITAERQLTDQNVRRLTRSIASVSKLETFMTSYRAEFANNSDQGF